MERKTSPKRKRILKLRSVHKPTREHKVKTKYTRKGKWLKRTGREN